MPVLAEIKLRSPRDGDLARGRSPESLARAMGACPIAGLSVVTEPEAFGGTPDLVSRVRDLLTVPILRKDFIKEPWQIEESAALGASAVLLIASMLDDERLAALQRLVGDLGLESVVEVHTAAELERARLSGLTLDVLGINNRDILVGETDESDVSVTERLTEGLPGGALVLSESAIGGPEDVLRARDAGADAVLVGTAVLQAPDLGAMLRSLIAVGWR